ncbi:hypothetical protein LCGC14_2146400 [marine sediment metagenome]|uniref:Glycosyltransferase 2-like domain-containing protein n=1 Tax=marine sediment metagenome TaxID=412755 RepID=A0A0F9DWT8_9ZZZZ
MNYLAKPYTSIVIRSKNEEQQLPKLLKSIKAQYFDKSYEIILVDSGSTDKTIEIAKKNKIRILNIPPESFSYGYALNMGVNFAQGEIIIFISAHTTHILNFG